jgi:hypothetical protein
MKQAAESMPEAKVRDLPSVESRHRSVEEINAGISQFLERHRGEVSEINRSANEDLRKRAPAILRERAREAFPTINRTLDRALSYANEAIYARDHILISESDLTLWHYHDLEEALSGIDTWRDYLSQEALNEISRQVGIHAETALRILDEYRAWGAHHEPYTETQRNAFDTLWALHALNPDVFPRDLVALTDQEFEEIGTKQLFSAMTPARRLIVHSKLAAYDTPRFRAIFGSEYSPEKLINKGWEYERRDSQEPLNVPMWSPYLRDIERSMAGSERNPSPLQ